MLKGLMSIEEFCARALFEDDPVKISDDEVGVIGNIPKKNSIKNKITLLANTGIFDDLENLLVTTTGKFNTQQFNNFNDKVLTHPDLGLGDFEDVDIQVDVSDGELTSKKKMLKKLNLLKDFLSDNKKQFSFTDLSSENPKLISVEDMANKANGDGAHLKFWKDFLKALFIWQNSSSGAQIGRGEGFFAFCFDGGKLLDSQGDVQISNSQQKIEIKNKNGKFKENSTGEDKLKKCLKEIISEDVSFSTEDQEIINGIGDILKQINKLEGTIYAKDYIGSLRHIETGDIGSGKLLHPDLRNKTFFNIVKRYVTSYLDTIDKLNEIGVPLKKDNTIIVDIPQSTAEMIYSNITSQKTKKALTDEVFNKCKISFAKTKGILTIGDFTYKVDDKECKRISTSKELKKSIKVNELKGEIEQIVEFFEDSVKKSIKDEIGITLNLIKTKIPKTYDGDMQNLIMKAIRDIARVQDIDNVEIDVESSQENELDITDRLGKIDAGGSNYNITREQAGFLGTILNKDENKFAWCDKNDDEDKKKKNRAKDIIFKYLCEYFGIETDENFNFKHAYDVDKAQEVAKEKIKEWLDESDITKKVQSLCDAGLILSYCAYTKSSKGKHFNYILIMDDGAKSSETSKDAMILDNFYLNKQKFICCSKDKFVTDLLVPKHIQSTAALTFGDRRGPGVELIKT